MKRLALGLWPCMAVFLIVSGCGHCKTNFEQGQDVQGRVTVTSFSLHFNQQEIKQDYVKDKLGAGWYDSLVLDSQNKQGVVFEYIPFGFTRDAKVGKAFDNAYAIQEKTGAQRVEPMFEVQMPNQRDDQHLPEAEHDDQWNLKQIQAQAAWGKIRKNCMKGQQAQIPENCIEGQEASGVYIAHPDTGFTQHPENWQMINKRPIIDADKGYDYCKVGKYPEDPLPHGLLDFPGHGTASASVIVSPEGCQLDGAAKCVNGIGRGAQIVPLRVGTSVILFNTRNLARAIQDVAEGKVAGQPQLVSIAMGGFPSVTLQKAVMKAEENGVLIIAASGNNIGIVVWPAAFSSVIAVAATNVRCRPWEFSSLGPAVDISAPGESVWRATLKERREYINQMGKGTTFAAGNTAGAAALWMVRHKTELAEWRTQGKQGRITQAFRYALKCSARNPKKTPDEACKLEATAGTTEAPAADTLCDNSQDNPIWDTNRFGYGILDASALLDVPLDSGTASRGREDERLPLFSSLYPAKTSNKDKDQIASDYLSFFPEEKRRKLSPSDPLDLSRFEMEILYHYTMNEDVRQNIGALVQATPANRDEVGQRAGQALLKQDLSKKLHESLTR